MKLSQLRDHPPVGLRVQDDRTGIHGIVAAVGHDLPFPPRPSGGQNMTKFERVVGRPIVRIAWNIGDEKIHPRPFRHECGNISIMDVEYQPAPEKLGEYKAHAIAPHYEGQRHATPGSN